MAKPGGITSRFWRMTTWKAARTAALSFLFSSRRRHTRFDCDWSSDVCSSDLINECIRSEGDPLKVVIGLPGKPPLLKSFALIGTTYRLEGRGAGRLAIIGPARMNYERVIRAVGYISRLFQRLEED